MPSQPVGSDPDSYGAKLRAKGVQIDAGAAKSGRRGRPSDNARYNGWERGVTGEHRPDGTFMPYLDSTGTVVRNKRMSEGQFDKAKEVLHQRRQTASA